MRQPRDKRLRNLTVSWPIGRPISLQLWCARSRRSLLRGLHSRRFSWYEPRAVTGCGNRPRSLPQCHGATSAESRILNSKVSLSMIRSTRLDRTKSPTALEILLARRHLAQAEGRSSQGKPCHTRSDQQTRASRCCCRQAGQVWCYSGYTAATRTPLDPLSDLWQKLPMRPSHTSKSHPQQAYSRALTHLQQFRTPC